MALQTRTFNGAMRPLVALGSSLRRAAVFASTRNALRARGCVSSAGQVPRPTRLQLRRFDGFSSTRNALRARGCASSAGQVPRPTRLQLRRLFVTSVVPFVGFGLVDQTVLIHAGDTIDSTFGVVLGLPTLGAAALGQVFSDTSGVLFGGTIEALALRLGLPLAGLTVAQQRLGLVKRVSTAGSVCGVICGCLLGMTNLLIIDLAASERAKRAEELRTIMRAVIDDGRDVLNCTRATMWIVDEEHGELWSSVAHGVDGILRIPNDQMSIAGWVAHHQELVNIPDVKHDRRWASKAVKNEDFVPKTMICVPVVEGRRTLAVIQLLNKTEADGEVVPFDRTDEKLVTMIAGHCRIFMADDAEASDDASRSYAARLRALLAGLENAVSS